MLENNGWRGEFVARMPEVDPSMTYTFPNEILSGGLEFLGQVITTASTDVFHRLRLENAAEQEIVTAPAAVSYNLQGDVLTVSSVADFADSQVVEDVAFASLLSEQNRIIARAPVTIASGQAVELTRRDIFTVNA